MLAPIDLKNARLAQGKTTYEVALETGLSVSSISRFENGKQNFSRHSLAKISAAYDLPVEELLEMSTN